jgi:hypothetical protein
MPRSDALSCDFEIDSVYQLCITFRMEQALVRQLSAAWLNISRNNVTSNNKLGGATSQ